ncbi:MAG TPA: hypothetical protein VG297_04855 [Bryobacteraceae bacterium]|nr:hypothetical protein [Bryobacteraceae bacterium]
MNYTWDEVEAELVLRNLQQPIDEREKLRNYYLRLREECRVVTDTAKSLIQFGRE